jgi:hypothetical protein
MDGRAAEWASSLTPPYFTPIVEPFGIPWGIYEVPGEAADESGAFPQKWQFADTLFVREEL